MSARSALTVAIVVIMVGTSAAQKRIRRSELPPAVQRVADAESAGATIVGYQMDKEDGKLMYELQLIVKGHTRDLTIDPKGNLVEVEEEVAINSLPKNIIFGLRRGAGRWRITKVESLTKHGELVAYEAQVESGDKHFEIRVGPNGENLDRVE